MKKKVYQCLKMLEALKVGVMNMWSNAFSESVIHLQQRYSDICEVLKENLSLEEYNVIPTITPLDLGAIGRSYQREEAKTRLLQSLMVSIDMTIVYLRSLDMDLSKEIAKEKAELKKLKEEYKSKIAETDKLNKSLRTISETITHIKKGVPEVIRSELMKGIKKNHREIEKYTNSDTKSQQKKEE